MTVAARMEAAPRTLPPLGGRVLAVYTIAWAVLAAAGIGLVAISLLYPSAPTGILVLRLLKAAALIAVSTILFRRRRSDGVAAMLSIAFLLWTISSSVDFTVASAGSWPAVVDRFRFLFFALAMLLFPAGEWRPRWARQVAVATVAVFLIGLAEALAIVPTRLFLPLAIGCVLAAMLTLFQRFRGSCSVAEQQQLKWVAFGLATGIGLILAARAGAALIEPVLAPTMTRVLLEALFQLGIVIIALGFLVSLLRYRLYDAEAAISRSAAYAGLTLTLVATFAASEALIQNFGQNYFGADVGNASGAIAAAIAAVLLTPLHSRITGWAEAHFQRDLAALQQQLLELLAELAGSATPRQVGEAALPLIDEAIHAVRTALVIDGTLVAAYGVGSSDARRWARRWQPAADGLFGRDIRDRQFPVRMALRCPFGTIRGWLLLGPRPDGSLYGKDELEALAKIAPPLRRALLASRRREQEQAQKASWRRAVTRSIGQLSARIDQLETQMKRDRDFACSNRRHLAPEGDEEMALIQCPDGSKAGIRDHQPI